MNFQYKTVINSLKLLSLSLNEQEAYLPEFADVPDDVLSSFENAFLLLPPLIEDNNFSNNSIASILRLHNKIQWCMRNVDLDDFSNVEWNNIRQMAKEVLGTLDISLDKPDLDSI